MTDRIVLNIPHSSPALPAGGSGWGSGIGAPVERWTDWCTDTIFTVRPEGGGTVVPVVFPWSRFHCDVERLEDDPLEKEGRGIVYTRFGDLVRDITAAEAARIRSSLYDTHIARLKAALTPSSFLVDCHSFPSDLSEVEICIGVNDDWSRPDEELLARVTALFRDAGYRTALNEPYSNSMSPAMPFAYPSLMVEVNKAVYTTDGRTPSPEGMARLMGTVSALYGRILCE